VSLLDLLKTAINASALNCQANFLENCSQNYVQTQYVMMLELLTMRLL